MFPFNWYVTMLKRHPLKTNLGTAALIMSVGDVMAQRLEQADLGDLLTGRNPNLEGLSLNRRQTLRNYTSRLSLPVVRNNDTSIVDDVAQQKQQEQEVIKIPNPHDGLIYDTDSDIAVPNFSKCYSVMTNAVDRLSSSPPLILDKTRVVMMMGWSVFIYSPAHILLYQFFDKLLPKKNVWTITIRVLMSLLYSIPMNTLFFSYGVFTHHTIGWFADNFTRDGDEFCSSNDDDDGDDNERQERRQHDYIPFNTPKLISTCQLKLENELVTTVQRSASVWIPINFFNFSVMPPHLRPLSLLFFSVFWNCYMSLVQHRDVPLPLPMKERGLVGGDEKGRSGDDG